MFGLKNKIEKDKMTGKVFTCKYCGVPTDRTRVCDEHERDEKELMISKGWY